MAKLTDALAIRGNIIKNRLVMAPMVTFSFRGDNGAYYGKQHIEHYTDRAKGGTGLIILQATNVAGAAAATALWSPDNARALRQIARNLHLYGATAMMQLSCGDVDINGLTPDEIRALQTDMRQAAVSAWAMGFDGVEYHFAHGFTLCKFLDAAYNRRDDQYGGDVANRARILTEILPDLRHHTGDKFMVGVRLGEYAPQSADGLAAAKIFEQAGVDLLHVSFGMQPPAGPVPDGFICSPITYSGCRIKQAVGVPVIAVYEIRTAEQVRFLIENDYVDFAAVGRGLLVDPEFADHVINGEPVNKCLGCKECQWFTDHSRCPARKSAKR